MELGDSPGIGINGVLVPDPGLGLAWVMDGAVCDGNDGTRPSFAGFLGFEAVEDFLHRPVGGGVADAVKDLIAADRGGRHDEVAKLVFGEFFVALRGRSEDEEVALFVANEDLVADEDGG